MSGVYRHPVTVRFGMCDPAGIAYFPRFFDWYHQAMEAWFGDVLRAPYHQLLARHGFPAVQTSCDYQSPCRFGDRVVIELRLAEIGRSSLVLDYRVVGDGDGDDLRATARTKVVMIGTDPTLPDHLRSVAIPAKLRGRLLAFQAEEP